MIRPIQIDEAGPVAALWNANCQEACACSLSEEELANVVRLLGVSVDCAQAWCFVAIEDGAIVGFITFVLRPDPRGLGASAGEVEELYVQPHMRGRGIGKQLVNKAVATLRLEGVSVIRGATDRGATEAHAFWSKLGWENDLTLFTLYP